MSSIRWATAASADLSDIAAYLALDSPSADRTFVERVDHAVRQLLEHPQSGRGVPELERQNVDRYRGIVISPWRLFYRYDRDVIYVLALIDGRRDIQDILLRRLTRGADRRA